MDIQLSLITDMIYLTKTLSVGKFCKLFYQTVKRRANTVENVLSLIFVDETNYIIAFFFKNGKFSVVFYAVIYTNINSTTNHKLSPLKGLYIQSNIN